MSTPVTYEDMKNARNVFLESQITFNKVYYGYLSTILEEAGFLDKLVKLADGTQGQFRVSDDPYPNRPWSIKFFPVRKIDGKISCKSKFVPGFYSWEESTLIEQLKNLAEVVGDLP